MSDNTVVARGTLRSTVVVVQQTTNPLAAANTSLAVGLPNRLNQLVTDALMIPLAVVVRNEFRECRKCRSPNGITRARHSSLIVRTNRGDVPSAVEIQRRLG